MAEREPISKVIDDPATSEQRRHELELALEIRNYASEQLGLPDNGSYRRYVDLKRPFVVWNVVAAPELSLEPLRWCYPVVGCLTYRGYYDKKDAERFAAPLRAQANDVMVRGVRAYSTLGWFDDPLLSSMLEHGNMALAEVMFHELAHQIIYVKNDTVFNEAFATAVGQLGVKQWLRDTRPEKLPKYEQALKRQDQFLELLRQTSDSLRAMYISDISDDEKRIRKKEILTLLKARYAALRESWDGFRGYDRWFETPVNNARLVSVAVYRDRVPDFLRLFESCGKDFSRFYSAVKSMGILPQEQRHDRLTGVADCQG